MMPLGVGRAQVAARCASATSSTARRNRLLRSVHASSSRGAAFVVLAVGLAEPSVSTWFRGESRRPRCVEPLSSSFTSCRSLSLGEEQARPGRPPAPASQSSARSASATRRTDLRGFEAHARRSDTRQSTRTRWPPRIAHAPRIRPVQVERLAPSRGSGRSVVCVGEPRSSAGPRWL